MHDAEHRLWLVAVAGILAGLGCAGGSPDPGAAPPPTAEPAGSSTEKNHCAGGEPHHCASEGGKHTCSADHEPAAAPSATVDAGVTATDATAPAEAATADAGAAKPGHTHAPGTKPHKH